MRHRQIRGSFCVELSATIFTTKRLGVKDLLQEEGVLPFATHQLATSEVSRALDSGLYIGRVSSILTKGMYSCAAGTVF